MLLIAVCYGLLAWACACLFIKDRFSRIGLLAMLALSLFHLLGTPYDGFANDTTAHVEYIRYLLAHKTLPQDLQVSGARHPPGYYVPAALFYAMAAPWGEAAAWFAVRLFSMSLYIVFIVFSLLTLSHFLTPRTAYRAAALLVLFWPAGLTAGARITCDIALYAAMSAMLYTLLRWREQKNSKYLAAFFVASGFGMLAKNFAITLFGAALIYIFYTAATRRFPWRDLLRKKCVVSIVFFLSTIALTLSRLIFFFTLSPSDVEKSVGRSDSYFRLKYMFGYDFHYFFSAQLYDPTLPDGFTLFWNMFIRTLLLDQFLWQAPFFQLIIGLMFHGILAYMLLGFVLTLKDKPEKNLLCLLGWFSFVLIGCIMLFWAYANSPYASNARYGYILVPIAALFFGRILQWHFNHHSKILVLLGWGLVLPFVGASIALLLAQHLKIFVF